MENSDWTADSLGEMFEAADASSTSLRGWSEARFPARSSLALAPEFGKLKNAWKIYVLTAVSIADF